MDLLKKIRACTICQDHLPLGPGPVLNFVKGSKILLVGQAPGTKVHESGIPWNDASGERLRDWLGVTKEQFYDPKNFAIVPMGFCYPGKGSSGDLPPRPECSAKWMKPILDQLSEVELTLTIGAYAQNYFLKSELGLTETLRSWRKFTPKFFPLPHPSPRNNIWLKKNSWFEKQLVPQLQKQISKILQ